ncbi:MAG: fimbrial protein [Rhizobiaceae bacterium]|nr:fimbrial protein [Rhizobiaceae bacterium]
MANRVLDDENEEKPLDPAVERVRRRLVRFVGINLGLLFVALMAVVLAIVYRARSGPDAPPADIAAPPSDGVMSGSIPLPAGARIVSQSLSGGRIAIDAEIPGGRAIFLYDIGERRIVGRFDIAVE